jgi:hypothetical protein
VTFNWLQTHPSTVEILARVNGMANVDTFAKWFSQVKKKMRLPVRGWYKQHPWEDGPPMEVFCAYQPKRDNIRHVVETSRFCSLYPDAQFVRGNAPLPFNEDFIMVRKGVTFRGELHCATQDEQQIKQRVAKYQDCKDQILFVVSSNRGEDERKLHELAAWCKPLWDRALFTTLKALESQGPHAPVWLEYPSKILRRIKE